MLGHYFNLATQSLRQNKPMTVLMVATLALGIGASITTLTVLKAVSGDPLPGKSNFLFHPRVDPYTEDGYIPGQTKPPFTLSYPDAMNLLYAKKAEHQAALAVAPVKIMPSGVRHPILGQAVMTTADFFPMFDVPFQYGSGWNFSDDNNNVDVVVISDFINDNLFGGMNSVGETIRINGHDYRIAGVLKHWAPQPRFYASELDQRNYGEGDAVFLPLQTGLARGIETPYINCFGTGDRINLKTAPCTWLGLWVELPSDSAVSSYKNFLSNYAHQQAELGRFYRSEVALPNLRQLLIDEQIAPDSASLKTVLAFGFLLICIVNMSGLLLAKGLRRSQEIGIRRALGATRAGIFTQFMVEAGLIGLVGGALGLLFAALGLWGTRHQHTDYAGLAHLDIPMSALTFLVALGASLIAGWFPAWRASALAPALNLKIS